MRLVPRVMATMIAVAVAVGGVATPTPVSAISCLGNATQAYSGNGYLIPGGTDGSSAKIEFITTTLCSGSASSFSASWVGIQPNPPGTNKIVQVGFIHCDAPGTTCVQDNIPFYFYTWGWDQGPCTLRVPTANKAPKGNAGQGMPTYTVQVIGGTVDLRIAGASQATISKSLLEFCWSDAAEGSVWASETLDNGDQSGGPTSNHQNFENVQYLDGSWTTPGTPNPNTVCNLEVLPHQECDWAPTTPGKFWTWDSRF